MLILGILYNLIILLSLRNLTTKINLVVFRKSRAYEIH